MNKRFQDSNDRLIKFQTYVLVECPSCAKCAIATVDYDQNMAKILCPSCGYNKFKSTSTFVMGMKSQLITSADAYFNATIWLQHPFKNSVVWAYNYEHLDYLEAYIGALLREHKDRSHFTLLEKLPKFYHDAKNRESLMKIISNLRKK